MSALTIPPLTDSDVDEIRNDEPSPAEAQWCRSRMIAALREDPGFRAMLDRVRCAGLDGAPNNDGGLMNGPRQSNACKPATEASFWSGPQRCDRHSLSEPLQVFARHSGSRGREISYPIGIVQAELAIALALSEPGDRLSQRYDLFRDFLNLTRFGQLAMQFYPVAQALAEAGFTALALRVLNPNHENYSALLFQPQGDIEADANGVRNADRDLAHKQHAAFLSDAAKEEIEVVITPEYSTPWSVIEEALWNGTVPGQGALWVVGCESLTLEELNDFKERVSDIATVLYEHLAPEPGRFLDPVLYFFHARPTAGDATSRLVVVVQFKTSPMADDDHFENNGLQRGTRVYCFGDGTTQLRLATLICSDALVFMDEDAQGLYDRTLIIHIQLNPKPRQAQFRAYRSKLMRFDGDQTEVICLNWAKDVYMKAKHGRDCWHNISGTAWYLRPNKFDIRDHTLTTNHKNGLYYTWLTDCRCHALFFNYGPAVFSVTASKVAHISVPATLSRRGGPQLSATRQWDGAAQRWVEVVTLDDGFSSIVHEGGDATSDLETLASGNPFATERALALATGRIPKYEWHSLKELDSCMITSSEVVNRVTACQDPHADAVQFRTRRLKAAHRIVSILRSTPPPALDDLRSGFTFAWSDQSPHTNIVSAVNKRATAIYLGDDHTLDSVREIAARAADYIGQWERDEDAIVTGKQRLSVWYRNKEGQDVPFDPDRYVGFDQTHTESPFDIGREE